MEPKKKVTTIPATLERFSSSPLGAPMKRKVAAYARVSTDNEDQLSSYEAQVDYYTKYINARNDWEFVDVYTDEGISGTSTKHREGFKQMVSDALNGKIDLIVTKSVSRFARNTVDSLTTIRQLKESGVEVYFEKENIWTFDGKGELLITIMSSLAQEESRSISENSAWGHRKRFADGKAMVPFSRFLGYDRGPNGELVVNPEQAEVVREIYRLFLEGKTSFGIAKILTQEGIKTPTGKDCWCASSVDRILTNEKYKGDALLQKFFTVDFLTKKMKVNEGEIPQYYVENDHEAIIDPETFDLVQQQMRLRASGDRMRSGVRIFSGKVKCGCCGGWYGRRIWRSNDKYRRAVWQCSNKVCGTTKCTTPHLTDEELQSLFIQAVNKLITNKDEILQNLEEVKDTVFGTDSLIAERNDLEKKLDVLVKMADKLNQENANSCVNQTEYQVRYDQIVRDYNAAQEKLTAVSAEIEHRSTKLAAIEKFICGLKKADSLITEFNSEMWYCLVNYVTVYSRIDIRVTFRDGTEIPVALEAHRRRRSFSSP